MALFKHRARQPVAACVLAAILTPQANGIELKPATARAFDRYIRAAEERMADDLREGHFLVVDNLPDADRQQAYLHLREGQLYIERLHAKEEDRPIPVPGGLIHHWVGVGFIPGATLSRTLAILQKYDNHKTIYKPDVRESKLLERSGNEFKVYLQLYRKSLVTVVVNMNLDVEYTFPGATRAMSKAYSTRIAEVQDAGKPGEHELPVGNDHGYIWRLYTYWRIEEGEGGVYIQIESIGLSRRIPWEISWLVTPLVQSVPRSLLADLLNKTRTAVRTSSEGLSPSGESHSRTKVSASRREGKGLRLYNSIRLRCNFNLRSGRNRTQATLHN